MKRTISHCQGKGSISHNNRKFISKNIDTERTKDNITFVKIPIATAYKNLFGTAQAEYNEKQKREDRKIDNYYMHLFKHKECETVLKGSNKQKSFYEDIVQIGTMKDTAIGSEASEIAKICLCEYMQGFEKRNKNFYVFNAVLHCDEATPHLHIDYIPYGTFERGMKKQNSLSKALFEMGFGKDIKSISRWRENERNILQEICKNHGLEISAPQKARGTLTIEEYKTQKEELKKITEELQQKKENINLLNKTDTKISKLGFYKGVEVNNAILKGLAYDELKNENTRLKTALEGERENNKELQTAFSVASEYIEELKEENRTLKEKLKDLFSVDRAIERAEKNQLLNIIKELKRKLAKYEKIEEKTKEK